MSTSTTEGRSSAVGTPPATQLDVARLSSRFGVAFPICQITLMVGFSILILPHGGSPTDPAIERGLGVLGAATSYTNGNYLLALSGMLLLGFLGVVGLRLRRADSTGVLAAVAVASGTLIALLWPLAGVIHDVFLDIAQDGTDVRILAGADAIAPYSLALSALPRVFFVGAIVLGLRATGRSTGLQRTGIAVAALSLIGSATLVTGAAFPVLALASLAFELWVGVLAWRWLRDGQ